MGFTLFEQGEIEIWCHSWWHKVKYGSDEKNPDKYTTEWFCKKCKRKTGGVTCFSLGTWTFPIDK